MDISPKHDFKLIPYWTTRAAPCRSTDAGASGTLSDVLEPSASDPWLQLFNNSTWTHSGPLLDLEDLPSSYRKWSQDTVDGDLLPLLVPFMQFVHGFLAAHAPTYDHYWLTIRATRATREFDRPRWHSDELFFHERGGETWGEGHWKLTTALLGPGTLFQANGKRAREIQRRVRKAAKCTPRAKSHVCRAIRCVGCTEVWAEVREELARRFVDFPLAQTGPGECAYMRLGEKDGAIHSEPPSPGDRIFVNVVPGTEAEIRALVERWGMDFPRSWALKWHT